MPVAKTTRPRVPAGAVRAAEHEVTRLEERHRRVEQVERSGTPGTDSPVSADVSTTSAPDGEAQPASAEIRSPSAISRMSPGPSSRAGIDRRAPSSRGSPVRQPTLWRGPPPAPSTARSGGFLLLHRTRTYACSRDHRDGRAAATAGDPDARAGSDGGLVERRGQGMRVEAAARPPRHHARSAVRWSSPFTGDYAGLLLYRTMLDLFRARSVQARVDDGPALADAAIVNAVRCVPPENEPLPLEIGTCRQFLSATIAEMRHVKAILALGRIAHEFTIAALGARRAAAPFGHAARHAIAGFALFDSFHCSRYNTNTGRLTEEMFRQVFASIRAFLDQQP